MSLLSCHPSNYFNTLIIKWYLYSQWEQDIKKEETVSNEDWKFIHREREREKGWGRERKGDKESWTGSERIPRCPSPWAVFKHCYCEVVPHMSEVEIIDFRRKRWRTAHLLSSFCRLCVKHFIVGVHIDSQDQHQQKPTHILFKVNVNSIQTLSYQVLCNLNSSDTSTAGHNLFSEMN